MLAVREMRKDDEAAWLKLWAAYNAFYASDVPDEVTAATLARLLDPATSLVGRVATHSEEVVGFSASILHPSTWTIAPSCYLEDLFVAPDARGIGAGRALIQDLVEQGRTRGWSRLSWHTRSDNRAARRLYDSFARADNFVRYRISLT